jgi:hypothetical protein
VVRGEHQNASFLTCDADLPPFFLFATLDSPNTVLIKQTAPSGAKSALERGKIEKLDQQFNQKAAESQRFCGVYGGSVV